MPVGIQGLRGTGEFDQDHRPLNYRELYSLLEPNGSAPLNALLSMTASESTDDPEYKNFRDELPDRTFAVDNAGGYDAAATTISVDAVPQVGFVVKGSLIVNVTTGEVMHATADGDATSGTVQVVRNIGGTAFAISDNDDLIVAGFAAKEGDVSPNAVSFDADVASNYTQIFRTPYKVTETLRHTRLRTGSKEDEAQVKALKLHMSDIERAMFFGRKHITDPNSNQPTRYTGGLLSNISNVVDCAGNTTANTMTEEEFDDLLISSIFAYGSDTKIMFVGAKVAGHIQQFGKDRWQPTQLEGTYGVNLTGYKTYAGTLAVHLHPQFRQIPGLEDTAVIIDFPDLCYRYLEGRDTHLLKDRQGTDEDAVKHEYLTECGLELKQDKTHAIIKNWKLRK
ncbi:hypothetical protein GCM10023116_48270 [Kistimonas scapharcae]|uniref:Major capsid protein n=1 Tax=Kistimonas scapharcae TaxID=1036133 RepID=A0ABP8V8H3_9GAMM